MGPEARRRRLPNSNLYASHSAGSPAAAATIACERLRRPYCGASCQRLPLTAAMPLIDAMRSLLHPDDRAHNSSKGEAHPSVITKLAYRSPNVNSVDTTHTHQGREISGRSQILVKCRDV